MQLTAIKQIAELTDRKSKFDRRKLGIRLLSSLILNCGEQALNQDKSILRLILGVCGDSNFKIRTDGAIFLKEFIKKNHEELIGSSRMTETYIPELMYLVTDDDYFIKIEAIEALHFIMETIPLETVEKEVIPCFLKLITTEN